MRMSSCISTNCCSQKSQIILWLSRWVLGSNAHILFVPGVILSSASSTHARRKSSSGWIRGRKRALSVTKTNIHQIPPDVAYFITWGVQLYMSIIKYLQYLPFFSWRALDVVCTELDQCDEVGKKETRRKTGFWPCRYTEAHDESLVPPASLLLPTHLLILFSKWIDYFFSRFLMGKKRMRELEDEG